VKKQLVNHITQAVMAGDRTRVRQLVEQALAQGIPALEILEEGLKPGMQEIGDRFARLEVYLPEMMMSAEAMKGAMNVLEAELQRLAQEKSQQDSTRTVVIGTIQGDIHNLGKNIVSTMLVASGFKVTDLGTDVRPDTFIEEAQQEHTDIIAVSTLLTTTMPYIKDLIRDLRDLGIRDEYQVMVGGGPVTAEWAASIGADGYGDTAYDAVEMAQKLIRRQQRG
jgi:trimethylamine corrinoid protein